MKHLAIIFSLLFLTACSTTTGQYISNKVDEASVSAVDNSVHYICVKGRVGAVVGKFGQTQADWNAWKQICNITEEEAPMVLDSPSAQ